MINHNRWSRLRQWFRRVYRQPCLDMALPKRRIGQYLLNATIYLRWNSDVARFSMTSKKKCEACRDGARFDRPVSMAFQPILDVRARKVFGYEALLRGKDGAAAGTVLEQVSIRNRYAFDQKCRVTAIELATRLGLAAHDALLSINFLPNAVYEPKACIRLTLETALRTGFPVDRIMFEFTEVEPLDAAHLLGILRAYRDLGFKTAIDDFGAGFAGLERLCEFQPDVVKLDMSLIRAIDGSRIKRIIVRDTLFMLRSLGIDVVCEGVETSEEFACLQDLGVELMQGFLFAKPGFEALPRPDWP